MRVEHDRALAVAIGNNRKTKAWKNTTVLWSELLDRLSATVRTAETVAEYRAMSRDRQSQIKDVGGFVGGYCPGGNRSAVKTRSLLCLDADFASLALWDDWKLLYGSAAAAYSTHKHTGDKPRLRLVIPLSREVTAEEYPAVGRRIAETLGIDQFDDTTYQPQRVMFWPSTSADGDFYFRSMDAEFLDPDSVLRTYRDWRDITEWPTSGRVAELVRRTADKQQDPREKKGLVGAFCRAYSIRDAIEAFVPTYAPCDEPNRYTYTEGSTAAGVVIYDNTWSYSHHATDPASERLCNAWDLVRLHRFGELDDGLDQNASASSRPSYKAMSAFAAEDSRVKAQILEDRQRDADEAFAADPESRTPWSARLKYTEKGGLAQTIENAVLILENDENLAGGIAMNELEHSIVARKPLPWRANSSPQWTDADDAQLRLYLEQLYGLQGKDRIFDAVNIVAANNRFHPVRDYLDGCGWDGEPRIDRLLIDYLGAEDTPYTRAVTRKTLVAAVARIYNPGCKFDYMLTLQGRQGLGKSTLIARLGGQWFSDSFVTMQGKDAYEQVMGVWIMEVGELAGMRRAEAETIKLFISKQTDRFRPAYGRRTQSFQRQCIFIGTTNEAQFLRDSTGNRRFWVVGLPNAAKKNLWSDLTPEMIRLLWGEARTYYDTGEELFLPRDLEEEAARVQDSYSEESPIAGLVENYLNRKLPIDWKDLDLYSRRSWLGSREEGVELRRSVSAIEVWAEALGGDPARADRIVLKDIHAVIRSTGEWIWQRDRTALRGPYGVQKFYRRKEEGIEQ